MPDQNRKLVAALHIAGNIHFEIKYKMLKIKKRKGSF